MLTSIPKGEIIGIVLSLMSTSMQVDVTGMHVGVLKIVGMLMSIGKYVNRYTRKEIN